MNTRKRSPKDTHRWKALLSFFTGGAIYGTSCRQTVQRQRDLPANIYRHCSELPLYIFIDCLVNKNLAKLIRSGEATARELLAAWDGIFYEYCDISGSTDYRVYFLLSKEIGFLKSKILAIQVSLDCLRLRPSEKAVNVLRGFGYSYPFDYTNPESYQADIARVESKAKTHQVTLRIKEKEMEKITAAGERITERDFDQLRTNIWIHYKLRVDNHQVS